MNLNELIGNTMQSQRARIVRFSVVKGLVRSRNELNIIDESEYRLQPLEPKDQITISY
ncbi:MAG: hypothetical protein LBS33_06825 [Streptococcaceae bacterium]|jgi:hypothetical protein|nr:hypothetical protein [Streptococcaceae bacterium]